METLPRSFDLVILASYVSDQMCCSFYPMIQSIFYVQINLNLNEIILRLVGIYFIQLVGERR